MSNLQRFALRAFFVFAAFMSLTGGAFFIGYESLKSIRDLHYFLTLGFVLAGAFAARRLYSDCPQTFPSLSPGLVLTTACILFFFFHLSRQLASHAALQLPLWDFGFFDQILWNTARGNFLITSVRGGLPVFAEHFKPLLVPLSWIYKMTPHTSALLAITLLIQTSCIPAVYKIARQMGCTSVQALVFAFCAIIYRPFTNGVHFLYHTQMLADVFLLWGFYFALKERHLFSLAFFIAALSCKENICLDVMGLGLFLAARKNKTGLPAILLALAWLGLFLFVIEPHFRYAQHFKEKWVALSYLLHPSKEAFRQLLTPNPLVFLFTVFVPFLFLSFFAPGWPLLLAPPLALHLASLMPELRMVQYHYTGGLNALVWISAMTGFLKLKKKNFVTAALLISAFIFSQPSGLFKTDRALAEASRSENQKTAALLDSIPENYSVIAGQRFAGHLSHRSRLYVFCSMFPGAPYQKDVEKADLMIADKKSTDECAAASAESYKARGYAHVFSGETLDFYKSPETVLPQELLQKWEGIQSAPVKDYRKLFRDFYRGLVIMAVLFFLVIAARPETAPAGPLKPETRE